MRNELGDVRRSQVITTLQKKIGMRWAMLEQAPDQNSRRILIQAMRLADVIIRSTDLASLVQSIIDDMRDAGLSVTMEPSQSLVCECRLAALKRALTNLIDNAVKFGQTAHIAINTTSSTIEITVDDEGPGIPEQELSRVFEPFYRLDESRSRDSGGIGLGLAIAQSIVQSHGGELILTNRPTRGVRASVKLPR